jgi:hypothetical protein
MNYDRPRPTLPARSGVPVVLLRRRATPTNAIAETKP